MKFTRIEIESFGPLTRVDSGEVSPLPGFVAVLGPNEAGKSAFHQVLEAILYGFHPASREQNHFSPWGGSSVHVTGQLLCDDGRKIEVQRRLLKTSRGSQVMNGDVETLDNRPIPIVEHVDRRVYSEVYAITLAQLAGLHEAAWETVQEQLIVGMGAQHLRSVRTAIRGFRDSANKLWRPNKRGKQRYRELQTRLAELGAVRSEAEQRDRDLRDLDSELTGLRSRLAELGVDKEAASLQLQIRRDLLPLRQRLTRIDEIEEKLGDVSGLVVAPKDPVARDRELTERTLRSAERIARLESDLSELQASIGRLDESGLRMLEHASGLRSLANSAPLVHERAGRRAALEKEASAVESGIREAALPLLGVWPTGDLSPEAELSPVDWAVAGAPFRALQMSELRERLVEAEFAKRRRLDLEDRLRTVVDRTPDRAPLVNLWAGLLAFGSAAAVLAASLLSLPVAAAVGMGLLIAAGVVLAQSWSQRSATRQLQDARLEEQDELRRRLSETEDQERDAVDRAQRLMGPLGLQEARLNSPGEALLTDIAELKDLFHRREERLVELTRLTAEDEALRIKFDRMVPELNLDLPEELGAALWRLDERLHDLEQQATRIDEGTSEQERLRAALADEQSEHDRLNGLRTEFEKSVAEAGETCDAPGLRQLETRLEELGRLTALRDALESDAGDLDELRLRIEAAESDGEDWSEGHERAAQLQSQVEAIEAEAQEVRQQIGKLQEREKAVLREDTLDLVDGQILHLRNALRNVEWERDRKIVLARAMECAEDRFRREHQPDLLRRAEEHLGAITGGRYERILVGQNGNGHTFYLDAEHLPEPMPVGPPLSTGTLEQVYLALRLAIIEHLDRNGEALPLLLDEVLVNWDPDRRARVLELLAALAASRQIFLFTCHPHIAGEVADHGGMLLPLTPAKVV